MSCHVAVPSSTTLATMRCQSPLSSEALMSCERKQTTTQQKQNYPDSEEDEQQQQDGISS